MNKAVHASIDARKSAQGIAENGAMPAFEVSYFKAMLVGSMFVFFWVGAAIYALRAAILRATSRQTDFPPRLRALVGSGLRVFFRVLDRLSILRVTFDESEFVMPQGEAVVAANHPCLLDALAILARYPGTICIVKSQLTRTPIIKGFIEALGFVANDDSIRVIEECKAAMRRGGAPLLIFPEGSRSPRRGGLRDLSRGAAVVALRTGVPLVPVRIRCSPIILGKNQRWFDVPRGCVDLTIRVCYPLPTNTSVESLADNERNAAQELTQELREVFLR